MNFGIFSSLQKLSSENCQSTIKETTAHVPNNRARSVIQSNEKKEQAEWVSGCSFSEKYKTNSYGIGDFCPGCQWRACTRASGFRLLWKPQGQEQLRIHSRKASPHCRPRDCTKFESVFKVKYFSYRAQPANSSPVGGVPGQVAPAKLLDRFYPTK
ncbi:MAG: hypothetical protein ACREOO_02780 [bacterium]